MPDGWAGESGWRWCTADRTDLPAHGMHRSTVRHPAHTLPKFEVLRPRPRLQTRTIRRMVLLHVRAPG